MKFPARHPPHEYGVTALFEKTPGRESALRPNNVFTLVPPGGRAFRSARRFTGGFFPKMIDLLSYTGMTRINGLD
jgi:hypothetical protein